MASATDKLTAVTTVQEPRDINFPIEFNLWTYSFQGKDVYNWNFESQVTDFRILLNTTQASTVEIDLEDSDFQVLNDPIFAHWAWDIQDVSFSSQKQFKTSRLTNRTNTAYLGDSADLEWVLGQKPIDYSLSSSEGPAFRLCGISTQQTTVTLTMEDRVASWLRDQSGHKSWDRSQHTRAQFVAMLCREAGVDYFIPEIDVVQSVAQSTSSSTNPIDQIKPKRSGNFSFTAAGKRMFTSGQITFIEGLSANTGLDGAVVAAWVFAEENGSAAQARQAAGNHNWLNIGYFDSGPGKIAFNSAFASPTSAADQTAQFLIGKWGGASAGIQAITNTVGQSAQAQISAIQNSGWATSHYPTLPQIYANVSATAVTNGAIPVATAAGTATTASGYAFTRGPNENSWDCIQRLASEVAWYAFVRQNRLWFVSGNYLFSQIPQLTCEIGKQGVDYIDIDMDMGERDQLAQCMVYGRTSTWTALPGMVVEVVNRGPASGKWIVASAETHPLDATQRAIITLQKPIPKRSEPAATSTTSSGTTIGTGIAGTGPGTAGAAYWAAQQLSAKKLVYTQVNRLMMPLSQISQGATLYDCSASVSWVLLRGGFPLPNGISWGGWAPVSGDFVPGAAGLISGPGQQMTIWANSDHIFVEFHVPGQPHSQGNTVNPFGPGFGLFAWNTPQTGGWGGPSPGAGAPHFWAVHYPGT